jgi:hypothetical protein
VLGSVTAAANDVTINSVAQINDEANDATADITAATASLTAATGIGAANGSVDLSVSTVTLATTATGGIALNNLTASTFTDVNTTGAGNITVSGSGNTTFASVSSNSGNVALSVDSGDLTATSVTAGGAGDVTLTTTTSGNVVLGSVTAAANDVTISSVGQINDEANDAVADITAATTTLTAGTGIGAANGNVDLNVPAVTSVTSGTGGVNLNNLTDVAFGPVSTTTSGNIAIIGTAAITMNGAVSTTGGGTVTLNSGGTLTLAAAGDITADGAVSLTGATGISTAGDVTTTDDNVTYASATTLTGAVAINTGAGGAGNINFNSTLDGAQDLTLAAGTGDISFSGVVGAIRLDDVVINSATSVTATTFSAATITQSAGSGTTTFNGAVDTNGAGGVNLTGANLAVNNTITTTNGGTVTVSETGTANFAAAGDISADGAVSLTAGGGITTAGDITTTNDNITFASATTLSGNVTLNAASGNLAFNSTLGGPFSLQANSTGTTTFGGAVGGSALASLTTDAGGTTAINGGSVNTTGAQTYNDALTIDAAGNTTTLTGTNLTFASTVRSTTDGQDALIATGSGTTAFNGAVGDNGQRLAALTANGGGTTTVNGDVTTTGAQTYTDATRIDSDLVLATTNSAVSFATTLDSQSGETNDLTINTGSGAATFGGAIGGTVGGDFGTLTINNSAGAGVALPATTAQTLNLTTAGPVTDSGVITVAGTTTIAAGAGSNITLDNANNFGTVIITSANNVQLVDTNALDLGASTVAGTLGLTAGSHITQSGVLNVTGTTTFTMTSAGSDILLDTQANDLGANAPILAGTVANIRDLTLRNTNAAAKVPVISPAITNLSGLTGLRNFTLIYNNTGIALPGLTASGTMTINAGGAIIDNGPSVVPGLSILNANGFDIILDENNNFGTVQLAGAAITLFNVSSINLAGVQASSSFTLQNAGNLTVSSPITSGAAVNLGSTGGDLLINAGISTSSGGVNLEAAGNITASTGGTLATGGAVVVRAGGSVQLSTITTGGSNVTVTANSGAATFISPLAITGAFVTTATGDITFTGALTGGGSLVANTAAVTRFNGAINGLSNLTTNAGGSTVISGGVLSVTNNFLFRDAVTLGANTTITAPTGRFNLTLRGASDGGQTLTLNSTGDLIFGGAVGDSNQRLSSITTGTTGRTIFQGGQARTTGNQLYRNPVVLGTNTVMQADNLTFDSTLNTGAVIPAPSALGNDVIVNAAVTGESDLTALVSGATTFNAPVGQLSRLGDVVTDAAGATAIRANFAATGLTLNDPATFTAAGALTIDTTGAQNYANAVTLNTDLTFNSTLSAVFDASLPVPQGIRFAQGLVAGGRTVTVTAPGSTISVGGDIGTQNARLTTLSASGRYMVVGGNIWAQGDIKLAPGSATAGENDFLQFTGPAGSTQNTRIDSASGEIILGSGATVGTAKADVPGRSSIFKSNTGDLYLFGRKVTIQPNERMVVRDGSLIIIADGTDTADGITLSSTAATNYLVLVTNVTGSTPTIRIASRGPATVTTQGGQATDQGTELVAGAVYFYSSQYNSNNTRPTRESFAPSPNTELTFPYSTTNSGNITTRVGSDVITVLPDSGGQLHSVYVADLVLSNRFRPSVPGRLFYLDLITSSLPRRSFGALGTFIAPSDDLFGVANLPPMRALPTSGATPRTVLQSAFTPNVPLETREATPIEVDLSPAVREQLQALGIYARGLRAAEIRSRELRRGLFVTVPERERPREPDYEVAEARVEDRAVREVLSLATAAGLIGEEQEKLDEVARSLAAAYEAFSVLSLSLEAKDFRAWLEASENPDAVRVLAYMKALQQTLQRIELLGLTRQELASSKAQIYGSILRARLNAEPEFLRALVEGEAPPPTKVSAVEARPGRTGAD